MSRKPTAVNESAVNLLRHMVKAKSNLSCSSFSEIQALHEGIAKTTSEYLSVQTLSRFFGVIRSEFKPSHHTLDTLSQYLNYSSFRHFELLNEAGSPSSDGSLFVAELFSSMFSGIKNGGEHGVDRIARNILEWMIKNPQYYSDIYPTVAKTELGRKLFFEDFVNIDALNQGYGNSIHYYLLHSNSREEKLFGYAMCCYWYFLSNDEKKFREYFEYIQQYKHSEVISFHPRVIDRYYASIIYGQAIASHEKSSLKPVLADLDILTSNSISSLSCSVYSSEALLLTGEFQRAWEILNTDHSFSFVPDCVREEFDVQVRILKLLSGYLSENVSKRRCLSVYLDLVNKPLPFLSESYCNLFLYFIKYTMFTRNNLRKQVVERYRTLIQKTGFTYFQSFFGSTLDNHS